MVHRVLADAVLAAHLLYIVFVVVGGALALRWRWIAWIHVPAAAWGAAVELLGLPCPLTTLEVALRGSAGLAGYEGSFIERYLLPIIYPGRLTRGLQVALGGFVLALNGALYARFFATRSPAGSGASTTGEG